MTGKTIENIQKHADQRAICKVMVNHQGTQGEILKWKYYIPVLVG